MRRVGVLVCVVSLALALTLALGAGAGLAALPARIVRPRDDALVVRGEGPVPVVVRSRRGGLSARLELTGQSKGTVVRLRRTGPGVLRGSIPPKALRSGRDHLFLYSKKKAGRVAVARSHFTVAGRVRRGLLQLAGIGSHLRSSFPVSGRARPGTVLRADLDGHSVIGEFVREGPSFHARLAADDGVRFGHNRLTVTAFDRQSGDYRRIVNRFWVGRGAPLVGAGPDQTATVGQRVRLDGSSSAAGRGSLRMKWRIAAGPSHSGAHLRGVRSAHPTLVGARPGEYRLALAASQTGRRRTTGVATASSATTVAPSATTDTTEVCVQPDVLPEGVPIETIVSGSSPEVKVDGKSYPMANPANGWVQAVVLDRCSLEPVKTLTLGGQKMELEFFEDEIRGLSQDLVILSGGGGRHLTGVDPLRMIGELLEPIGGVEDPRDTGAFEEGSFSVIGTPGLAPGEATQLAGERLAPNAPPGAITGLLRTDSSGNFTFNWPAADRSPFEVGAAPGTNQNTIKVGSSSYTQELPGGGPGFHYVWVDPGTLAPLGQESVPATEGGLATMNARLGAAKVAGALLFISSYGSPNLVQPGNAGFVQAASSLALELREWGVNPYAFLSLAGSGGYSFVGRFQGPGFEGPGAGAELVQAEAGSPTDRITGELVRSRQGSWAPGTNGSPESFSAGPLGDSVFAKVLAQPAQPFKPLPAAAQLYIYKKLFKTESEPTPDPEFGIRRFYWAGGSDYNAQGFTTLHGQLAVLPPCQSEPCAAEFAGTKKTLLTEFAEVSQVKRFFERGGQGSIGEIFSLATGNGGKVFFGVQQYIDGLYGNPSGTVEGEGTFDIYNGVLTAGEGAIGLVPGGEEFSSALSLIQGIGEIGQGLALDGEGGSVYNPNTVKVDALEWADHINAITEAGFSGLRAASSLFVSDEGRLDKMVELLRTKASMGGLAIGEPEETAMRVGIERSEERYMWTTMLPLAVKVAPPFSGPFNAPLPATGFAAKRGVTEVNVPTGRGILYGYDIAPYVVTNGVQLPSEGVNELLFGQIKGGENVAEGPLGFKPRYFLAPTRALYGRASSTGFGALQLCHQEEIDNYEVKKSREEYDRKGFNYTFEWVPCAEAEPPYSSEPHPGG